MKFEHGIWIDAFRNAKLNIWLVLGTVALFLAIIVITDLGYIKGASSAASIFVWLYLAIPTHKTALTGSSGYLAIGNRKNTSPFMWRAGAMSAAGLFGFLFAIPLIGGGKEQSSILIGMILYGFTEILILSKWGTCLPSIVDGSDVTFKAAGIRGNKVFKYVFVRLLGCNGIILLVSFFVGALLIGMFGGSGDIWSKETGLSVGTLAGFLVMFLGFAFHVVMLSTILSRAYLIAEGKALLSTKDRDIPQTNDEIKTDTEQVIHKLWGEFTDSLWHQKWTALLSALVIAGTYQITKNSNQDLYFLIPLPLILLPLGFTSLTRSLTLKSSLPSLNKTTVESSWFPFAWRSILFTLAGTVPAIGFYLLPRLVFNPVLDQLLSVVSFVIVETLLLAKFGTILPSTVTGNDRTLSEASSRGSRTFKYVLTKMWLYNAMIIVAAWFGGSLIYFVIMLAVDITLGHGHIEALRPLLEGLIFVPLVLTTIMTALVSTRAYLIAEDEVKRTPASANAS